MYGFCHRFELNVLNTNNIIIIDDIKDIILKYYLIKERWNEKIIGKDIKISEPNRSFKHCGNKHKWQSAFGIRKISKGTFMWKIKLKREYLAGNSICIGIVDSKKIGKNIIDPKTYVGDFGYGYYSYDGTKEHNGDYRNYGKSYDKDDIITVILDMDKLNLAFEHNGEYQGIAFSGLPKASYSLAISCYNTGDEFKMIL